MWWYDPRLSYDDNYERGPFGTFAAPPPDAPPVPATASATFLGHVVNSAFGIPAGPLLNARFCAAAFAHGFDINVYKTVRSRAVPAHAHPNVLRVRAPARLGPGQTLTADAEYDRAISISNSFGVPSQDPDVWQPDVARAVESAGPGQLLILSFQGTRGGGTAEFIADHVRTARLAAATGAPALELNLSCPNEGAANLLCFDTAAVTRIVSAVKEEIGDLPLLLKLAHFEGRGGVADALAGLVRATASMVAGYAAINTVPATLVTAGGKQALPGQGRDVAGVCGEAIGWAAHDMVARLARLREDCGEPFVIVGVGGVMTVADAVALWRAGADAVMSATGAMRNPWLASAVRDTLG